MTLCDTTRRRWWQFGLRSLFLVVFVVGLCSALVKSAGIVGMMVSLVFVIPLGVSLLGNPPELWVLRALVVYGTISVLTLPFLDSFWWGEFPLLAVFQVPKASFAHLIRNWIVTDVVIPLGWSRGSRSPDYTLARPYALAMAYLIPLTIVIAVLWGRRRFDKPYVRWICALIALVVLDYFMTLALASGPGLSFY